MPEEDIDFSALSADSPCEDQLRFWKHQCTKYVGVYEKNLVLSRECERQDSVTQKLEDELDEIKDYLRLVREERDTLKWRLESAAKRNNQE